MKLFVAGVRGWDTGLRRFFDDLVADNDRTNDKDELPGAACKIFIPRETRIAAPVSFNRWSAVLAIAVERIRIPVDEAIGNIRRVQRRSPPIDEFAI